MSGMVSFTGDITENIDIKGSSSNGDRTSANDCDITTFGTIMYLT
jgi:hypothetical protein